MKIERIFNDTSTHSLDDTSSILTDILITEFMNKITQSANSEVNNEEVAA